MVTTNVGKFWKIFSTLKIITTKQEFTAEVKHAEPGFTTCFNVLIFYIIQSFALNVYSFVSEVTTIAFPLTQTSFHSFCNC